MNYSEIFHFMRPELTLIVTIALLFLFDLFAPERLRRYFHPLACVLLTVQILVNIVPTPDSGQLFGGMYQYEPMQSIVKSMLAIGRLSSSCNRTNGCGARTPPINGENSIC